MSTTIDSKTKWLESVATELGKWAMRSDGCVNWSHDPEDRYGGWVKCLWNGQTATVQFDQERETLSAYPDYEVANEPRFDHLSIEQLADAVQKCVHAAYVANSNQERDRKKREKEESVRNAEAIRKRQEEWQKNKVPGVHTGRVLESSGFTCVISCPSVALEVKDGDPIWVLPTKPKTDSLSGWE